MNELINAIVNNATLLLVGATLLLLFGCLAVAAHRSPVHRQRLAEFAIASTLIWLILAVAPLPRPLARGYFSQLCQAISRKAPTAPDMQSPLPANANHTEHPAPQSSSAIAGTELKLSTSDAAALAEIWPMLTPTSPEGVARDGQISRIQLTSKPQAVASATVSPAPKTDAVAATSVEGGPATLGARFTAFMQGRGTMLLLCAYGFGVALCAGWIVLGRVLLAKIVRTSKKPEYWLNELFADLCEERGTLNVWLALSDRYPRAMSFGIRRPTIVMPSSICVPENAELLRHVLRHELVHVGRRDAWGTLLFNLSFLFLFFHPAFWWLRSRARLSAELVADEWAATRSSRDEYARELIAFVRATRRASFLPAGATGVLGSTTPFSRRIEMLVRRERPLVMHSSPAWRIASCGMLGLLIVGMAASLGRTAPQEEQITKVEKTTDPETIVVRVDGDDSAAEAQESRDQVVELKEIVDDAASQGHLTRLAQKYAVLVRRSAELQEQVAEMKKLLAESKAATQRPKSAHAGDAHAWTLKDGKPVEIQIEELGALKGLKELNGSLKEVQALKELPHVMQYDVKVLDDDAAEVILDRKSSEAKKELMQKAKKRAVIIKKDHNTKRDKDGNEHEEAIIELKTDGGELVIEVGPDHVAKVKKSKGFHNGAELEQALKALQEAKDGVVPAKRLKELVESAKTLHQFHVEHDKASKHEESEAAKEEAEEQHFKVQIAPELRAKVEAQHKIIRELEQKLGNAAESSESFEAPKSGQKAKRRQLIVKAVPKATAAGTVEKRDAAGSEQREIEVIVQDGKKPEATAGAVVGTGGPHHQRKQLTKIVEDGISTTMPALEGSTDLMRLAELVSNAVGELEQAKAALEDAQAAAGSPNLHLAEARVKSAERKVRLLSRIAQSMHTVLAAKAKRLHELREQNAIPASAAEEIDSKLRIIELILSDVKTAGLELALPAMTVSVSVPPVASSLAGVPVRAATVAAAPKPAIAPVAPKAVAAPAITAPRSPAAPVAPTAPKATATPATKATAKSTTKVSVAPVVSVVPVSYVGTVVPVTVQPKK